MAITAEMVKEPRNFPLQNLPSLQIQTSDKYQCFKLSNVKKKCDWESILGKKSMPTGEKCLVVQSNEERNSVSCINSFINKLELKTQPS